MIFNLRYLNNILDIVLYQIYCHWSNIATTFDKFMINYTAPDSFNHVRVSVEQNRSAEDTQATLHHYMTSITILEWINQRALESTHDALSREEGKQEFPMISENLTDNLANVRARTDRSHTPSVSSDRSLDLQSSYLHQNT